MILNVLVAGMMATMMQIPPESVHTDTTIDVRPGARLNVVDFTGGIAVTSWGKNAVHISAAHSNRVWVNVTATGPNLDVRGVAPRGFQARVAYTLQVPAWMPLMLQGVYADIDVRGMKSEVSAQTVRGDVDVEGGEGMVRASSVEGAVTVNGSRGRLELSTVNDGVNVSDAHGEIVVNAINGDIHLDRIESPMVEASTVDGDVLYAGELRKDGRYNLSTHDGDLMLGVPENANATIQVATFDGDFESAFPINIERAQRGRRFNFTLGDGSAQVNLESFDGTVRLEKLVHLREAMDRFQERAARAPHAPAMPEMRRKLREIRRQMREITPAPPAPTTPPEPEHP